jgi:hypothetical protein
MRIWFLKMNRMIGLWLLNANKTEELVTAKQEGKFQPPPYKFKPPPNTAKKLVENQIFLGQRKLYQRANAVDQKVT